jgi:hypothetical protein
MTADEIIELIDWVEASEDENQRASRLRRMQEKIYPKTLTPFHLEQRKRSAERAKKIWQEREDAKDPLPENIIAPVPPLQWDGFNTNDESYMRGSKHDGTAAEVEYMQALANGSPFDADPNDRPTKKRK